MSDLPFGLKEIRIAPIGPDGLPTDFSTVAIKDFRFIEVPSLSDEELAQSVKVMGGGELSWEFGPCELSKEVGVLFGILCQCCYSPLPKKRRCRRCVAQP